MTALAAMLAGLLLIAGAACLYLTTPGQRLLKMPLPPRAASTAGFAGLLAALAILLRLMGPATAIFTWTIGLMLVWTIAPVMIAWLRYRKAIKP